MLWRRRTFRSNDNSTGQRNKSWSNRQKRNERRRRGFHPWMKVVPGTTTLSNSEKYLLIPDYLLLVQWLMGIRNFIIKGSWGIQDENVMKQHLFEKREAQGRSDEIISREINFNSISSLLLSQILFSILELISFLQNRTEIRLLNNWYKWATTWRNHLHFLIGWFWNTIIYVLVYWPTSTDIYSFLSSRSLSACINYSHFIPRVFAISVSLHTFFFFFSLSLHIHTS